MCTFFKPWNEFHILGFSSHLLLHTPIPSPLSLPLYYKYIQVFLKGHIYFLSNAPPSAGLRWTCLLWVFSRLLWEQLRPASVTRASARGATKAVRHHWSTFVKDLLGLPTWDSWGLRACRRPTPRVTALSSQGAKRARRGQPCQPEPQSQLLPWTQLRITVIGRVPWDSPGSCPRLRHPHWSRRKLLLWSILAWEDLTWQFPLPHLPGHKPHLPARFLTGKGQVT